MGRRVFSAEDVLADNHGNTINTNDLKRFSMQARGDKKKGTVILGVSVCSLVFTISAIALCVVYMASDHYKPIQSLQVQLDKQDKQIEAVLEKISQLSGIDAKDDRQVRDENGLLDCQDVLNLNKSADSGVYTVHFTNSSIMELSVYCDMTTQGGGWIVVQRRQDGSEDFYRGWEDYKAGFGKLDGEFWLGLDNIHMLVSGDEIWQLLINMRFNGLEKYAMYKMFYIGPENTNYQLTLGKYSGDAGDSLKNHHNGMSFSTKDRDNDRHSINCAVNYTGAWWYNHCHYSNLNGVYGADKYRGVRWKSLSGGNSVQFSEMKIKRKN